MNRASLPFTAASITTSSSIANRNVWWRSPGTSGYRAYDSAGVSRSPAYSISRVPAGMYCVANAPSPSMQDGRISNGRSRGIPKFMSRDEPSNGGTVERWNGGTVERWNGGTVERWNGGTEERYTV